jgi:hypothetical protein
VAALSIANLFLSTGVNEILTAPIQIGISCKDNFSGSYLAINNSITPGAPVVKN